MSLLNTATSLIFIFLLYSLFATALQESMATMIQRRSKTLYDGIKTMLSNTPTRQLSFLVWIAYWVGIWWLVKKIKVAAQMDSTDAKKLRSRDEKIADSANASACLYERFYDHPIIKNYGQNNLFSKPSYITDKNFGTIMVDVIKDLTAENKTRTATFELVQGAIDKHKDRLEQEVVQILQYHLNESAGDLDVFRSRLEQWYNDTMDRVTGWYKRNTQFWLFAIGIFLAVSFNVDTIEIGGVLSKNPVLSEEVANIAVAMIQKDSSKGTNTPVLDSIRKQITQTNTLLGLGWDDYGKNDRAFIKKLQETKRGNRGVLSVIYFLFVDDNEWEKFSTENAAIFSEKFYNNYSFYISLRYIAYKSTPTKWFGFFITAIAIGLGAPFWFDLLNKLSSVRAAGKAINAKVESSNQKATQTIDG